MLHIPQSRKIVAPRRRGLIPEQKFGIRGRLRGIEIDTATGEIRRHVNHNIVTRAFLATIPLSFYQARDAYITEIRVGTGITAPADTDTGLATELAAKAITDPITTTFLTGATPYSIATVQFGLAEAIGKITEAGQFDSDDALANRALFGRGEVEAATQTDPVVITSTDHGLVNGDLVRFDGVAGMTSLNFVASNWYYVKKLTDNTFELYTDSGLTASLDGTGFGAFTVSSPETARWTKVIDKTSTKVFIVSFEMQAENAG